MRPIMLLKLAANIIHDTTLLSDVCTDQITRATQHTSSAVRTRYCVMPGAMQYTIADFTNCARA
jgi:hypothetical protein